MARQKNDGKGRMGGRKKGTPNKVTKDTRTAISLFIDEHFEEFMTEWGTLEPRDKCEVYIKMCKFVLPTLSSVDMNAKVEDKSFSDELRALRDEG